MKVYFFQDNSFFRTHDGTNPFFNPIIRVCEKNGIDWKVFTYDPCVKCGYEDGHVGCFGRFVKISVWFWRIVHFAWHCETWKINVLFGKLIRPFVKRKYDADIFITIAGNFWRELSGAFPNARVVDMQHGVIYSKHSGYFVNDGRLRDIYQKLRHCEFWVYGKGYADCFFKNPENAKDLEGRVKIIGDVARASAQVKLKVESCKLKVDGEVESKGEKVEGGERNLVVMSLQLTNDLDQEEKAGSVKVMEEFFSEFFKKYGDKYTVLFKHHPRFNNCYDLSDFYKKFPQIKESKAPWDELYPKMAMHITFASTSTFDCAANGIPTLLLNYPHKRAINRAYWEYDFNYPLFNYSMDEVLSDFNKCSKIVSGWYDECYAPFDEEKCLKMIKGED